MWRCWLGPRGRQPVNPTHAAQTACCAVAAAGQDEVALVARRGQTSPTLNSRVEEQRLGNKQNKTSRTKKGFTRSSVAEKGCHTGWLQVVCRRPGGATVLAGGRHRASGWGLGLRNPRSGAQAPALCLVRFPVRVGAGLAAVPHSPAPAGSKQAASARKHRTPGRQAGSLRNNTGQAPGVTASLPLQPRAQLTRCNDAGRSCCRSPLLRTP